VGHLVARHGAENASKSIWLIILKLVLNISEKITKPIFSRHITISCCLPLE
ncbi:hypothetical protein MKX03_030958, partial [Papaver bracteatum]